MNILAQVADAMQEILTERRCLNIVGTAEKLCSSTP